jgi:type IV pilus assembly protein PilB
MPPRKRLGQLLTELKVIDEAQLQSALGHQKQWGGKIGAILVEKGFCSEDQMVGVLSQHLGIATVKLLDSPVDPRAVKAVSRAVAERLHVFAYEVIGAGRSEVVSVAMSDPTDLSAVDQLAFHTGKRIKAMLAADSEILAAIEQHYPEGSKAKSATNVRPLAAVGSRPTPLRAAPPVATPVEPLRKVATPVEPLRKVEAARPAPYIPPPVPQNAQPVPIALDEIEPELPSEADVHSEHGFDAEQERLRAQFPATDAIEAPPESEEPMTLETPTTLQGWKEGPQAAGIDWREQTGPVETKTEQPPPAETAASENVTPPMGTEPVPEQAASDWHDGGNRSEEARAQWHVEDPAPQEAEQAPAEWQVAEEHAPEAEQAPAEWQAGDTQPSEEAPAEWQAEADQTQPTETAPAETAPAEWAGTEQAAAEPAPESREWSAQEPRVPEAASEGFEPDVPQDAWEDEPVEDATEAPAEWTESAEGEAGEASAFAAETPEAGGPIALPGPKEPAIAEAFAESSALEEVPREESAPAEGEGGHGAEAAPYEAPQSDAEESTDRFRTPTATPAFGVASSSLEPGPSEDHTDEWPPQEATQEEVEWVAAAEALSAADVATLGALGLDPGDGMGAMRALACLVRVLNRRQAIDVEELAAEIRESRTSAAEVASSGGNPGAEARGAFAGLVAHHPAVRASLPRTGGFS